MVNKNIEKNFKKTINKIEKDIKYEIECNKNFKKKLNALKDELKIIKNIENDKKNIESQALEIKKQEVYDDYYYYFKKIYFFISYLLLF
jgi:hypothetical protein